MHKVKIDPNIETSTVALNYSMPKLQPTICFLFLKKLQNKLARNLFLQYFLVFDKNTKIVINKPRQ